MRIGIDVGGTNTDAVLMDGLVVVSGVKTSTTANVTDGIVTALRTVLADAAVEAQQVQAVMIGTTHFTNAVVEAKRLVPTAAVRLGLPATEALPPMIDWPERLRTAVGGHSYLCHGGHEFDGREISPLDEDELRRAAEDIAAKGLSSIAITSVFSPVNAEFEHRAAEILGGELGDVWISLSNEIGRIGLLERENATIMNACLRELAAEIVGAFRSALHEFGIDAPLYLSQNDGTLMDDDFVQRYPVATFASGPTNSMRGAALLSGELDCAVIDIGGTTTDIGILQQGYPREASTAIEIGGVRTNFRMPDVLSLGIGGGSIVRDDGGIDDGGVTVGPDSVGYELTRRGLAFGGDTLTASDVAIAAGRAEFGDRSLVGHLDESFVREALAQIEERIAEAVDRMKVTAGSIPVVLVGGGSVLLDDVLRGASRVVRPPHFGAANAVGAAIGQVGGEVERVFALEKMSRDDALAQAQDEAVEKAIAAGAVPSTVRVVDIEEVALAYVPGNATRIKVKVVGDLELEKSGLASDR